MNVDKLIFSKLDESYKDFVKFDDEFQVFIIEKGMIIIIQTKNNIVYTISDGFFDLELKTNLFSICQLQEND
jgi:hypothetical protein